MKIEDLDKKYCVGLGEILFDVLPTGSQLGGAPANFAYHAGQHGLHSVAVSKAPCKGKSFMYRLKF